MVLATLDGGESWRSHPATLKEGLTGVHFTDARTGWAMAENGEIIGEKGTVFATRDGGQTWENLAGNNNEHLLGVHFLDSQTGWTVGRSGTILHTLDGGRTWNPPANIDWRPPAVDKPIYIQPPEPSFPGPMRDARPAPAAWRNDAQTMRRGGESTSRVPTTSSGLTARRQNLGETLAVAVPKPDSLAPLILSDKELFVKLEMLHELLKKGIITEQEYDAQKVELLNFIVTKEQLFANSAREQLFANLERMHELMTKGVLTREEFNEKKADLLKRMV